MSSRSGLVPVKTQDPDCPSLTTAVTVLSSAMLANTVAGSSRQGASVSHAGSRRQALALTGWAAGAASEVCTLPASGSDLGLVPPTVASIAATMLAAALEASGTGNAASLTAAVASDEVLGPGLRAQSLSTTVLSDSRSL